MYRFAQRPVAAVPIENAVRVVVIDVGAAPRYNASALLHHVFTPV